jgi:hypothetical protein
MSRAKVDTMTNTNSSGWRTIHTNDPQGGWLNISKHFPGIIVGQNMDICTTIYQGIDRN